MKNNKSAVYIIAVALTILYIINAVVCLVLLATHIINWFAFIIVLIAGAVELILVWALNNALNRITVLESLLIEKKVIEENEIIEPDETQTLNEPNENISFCEHCGFQLFPEDKVCPNCNNEVHCKEETNK